MLLYVNINNTPIQQACITLSTFGATSDVSSNNACENGILTFALQPVTQVFTTRRSSSHYSQIRTFVDINTLNTIVASNDHPIYEVMCECWIPVSALNSSHKLLSVLNTIVHVLDVQTLSNESNDLITCYNIEVAQNHNYLISTSQTHDSSILVHNPNTQPTYLPAAAGGHPSNGKVGKYGSLKVKNTPGVDVTKGHFVPRSAYPAVYKNLKNDVLAGGHQGNGKMIAIVHDADVEKHLTSSTTRPIPIQLLTPIGPESKTFLQEGCKTARQEAVTGVKS